MNVLTDKPVGEIVAEDYRAATVFKNHGLDFCCGGGKKLSEACEKKGISLAEVLKELESLSDSPSRQNNYNEWSLGFLIDYIVHNHHSYVRSKLPEIKSYAKKVARVHGNTYPVLYTMLELFLKLENELLSHLEKEEDILFPYVKKLEASKLEEAREHIKPGCETAAKCIAMMEEEHELAGSVLDRMSEISNEFTPPEGACKTFTVYFLNLREFQEDLHLHVHLENNILFPKAMKLERENRS